MVKVKGALTPINPWRVGGESESLTEGTQGIRSENGSSMQFGTAETRKKTEILTIVREPVIRWTPCNGGETGTLVMPGKDGPFDFPLPGSAIKGPLATAPCIT